MKRMISFVALFMTIYAGAQVPQKINTPYEYKFLMADSLGLPKDTFPVPVAHRNVPFFASKGDKIYLWSTSQHKWVTAGDGAAGGDTLTIENGLRALFDTLVSYRGANQIVFKALQNLDGWGLSSAKTVTDTTISYSRLIDSSKVASWDRLYKVRDSLGLLIGSGSGGGTPGGSSTQLQYNNAGSFAGAAKLIYDGHGLTISSDQLAGLTISNTNAAASDGAAGATIVASDGSTALFFQRRAGLAGFTGQNGFAIDKYGTSNSILKLFNNGTIVAPDYASGNTPPTTSGTKHMLTVDANGLFSHEPITAANSMRFGIAGEDATASSNRTFNGVGYLFSIDSFGSVNLSSKATSTQGVNTFSLASNGIQGTHYPKLGGSTSFMLQDASASLEALGPDGKNAAVSVFPSYVKIKGDSMTFNNASTFGASSVLPYYVGFNAYGTLRTRTLSQLQFDVIGTSPDLYTSSGALRVQPDQTLQRINFLKDGVYVSQRPQLNIIKGSGDGSILASDDPANNRINYTVNFPIGLSSTDKTKLDAYPVLSNSTSQWLRSDGTNANLPTGTTDGGAKIDASGIEDSTFLMAQTSPDRTSFSGSTVSPVYFYAERAAWFRNPATLAVKINATNAGDVDIAFYTIKRTYISSIPGYRDIITVLRTERKTLTSGINTFNKSDFAITDWDFSGAYRVYVAISAVTDGTVFHADTGSGIDSSGYSFYPNITGGNPRIEASYAQFRVGYGIQVNMPVPLITDVKGIREAIDKIKKVKTFPELVIALATYNEVFVDAGTFVFTSTLHLRDNQSIHGSGQATVFKLAPGVSTAFSIGEDGHGYHSTITDIMFDGDSAINPASGYTVTYLSDVTSSVNIGTEKMIVMHTVADVRLLNLGFKNVNNTCIEVQGTGRYQTGGLMADNIRIEYSYFGMTFDLEGEFNKVTNLDVWKSICGIKDISGNNGFSNCQFTDGVVGTWLEDGLNDGHGVFSGCIFAHNREKNIYAHNLTNGFTFSGCHMMGNPSLIDNCYGFNWTGGLISGQMIFQNCTGANMITGAMFLGQFGSIPVYSAGVTINVNTVNPTLKNNYWDNPAWETPYPIRN